MSKQVVKLLARVWPMAAQFLGGLLAGAGVLYLMSPAANAALGG